MKKFLCIALVLIMVASLAACGVKKAEKYAAKDGAYYYGSKVGTEKLKNTPNPLDPAKIYGSVTYNEKMLYGHFSLENEEKAIKNFAKTAVFEEVEYASSYSTNMEDSLFTVNLSTLPVQLEAGPSSCYDARKLRGEHEWAELTFWNEDGYRTYVLCTYTVSGNTVSFAPLDGYEIVYNEDSKVDKIRYIPGEDTLDYTFSFNGNDLTLSRNGQSITLKTREFSNNFTTNTPDLGGYLAVGSPAFDGVDNFSCSIYDNFPDLDTSVYMYQLDETFISDSDYSGNAAVRYTVDGQISFYWESKDDAGNVTEHLHHFVYFPGDGRSMTLTDGKQVYYYTESYSSREAVALGEGMTAEELAALNGLTDAQLEEIAKKKANLLEDLAKAYQDAGLKVSINPATGEIALDSAVLFDVNEYAISEEGKAFLQKFTQIYTSTVYGDTYADFVSRVIIEGHTDTNGGYDMNLELSQNRANSVKDYCLSAECGVDSAYTAQFGESLEAVGYSYDKPVYDADGKVDMDASRRVSFRFIVSLEQYAQN